MKKTILTLCLALFTIVSFSQPAFQDKNLNAAYANYIQLKDALVASDLVKSKKAAAELQKSLAVVNESKKATELTAKLATSADLAAQRKVFSSLSNEMAILVKGGKLSSGTLYLEYCPMANNNQGAYWLSNEKEIKNPYFGNMMLKCGSVKETIQ
jgi:hypothetical protein